MRKFESVKVGEELYEIVYKIAYHKIRKEIDGESAKLLKEWIGCEKILKSNQTNEYLFVNLIQEAKVDD